MHLCFNLFYLLCFTFILLEKYLIAVLWVYRIFRAIFCNRPKIKAEIETVKKS